MQHVLGFRVCVSTACRPAGTPSTQSPSTRCARSQRACGWRCGATWARVEGFVSHRMPPVRALVSPKMVKMGFPESAILIRACAAQARAQGADLRVTSISPGTVSSEI